MSATPISTPSVKQLLSRLHEAEFENVWIVENQSVALGNTSERTHKFELGKDSSVHSQWGFTLKSLDDSATDFPQNAGCILLECKLNKILAPGIKAFRHCRFSVHVTDNSGEIKLDENDASGMKEGGFFNFFMERFCNWGGVFDPFGGIKISFKLCISNADLELLELVEQVQVESVTAARTALTSLLTRGQKGRDTILICSDGKELKCHKKILEAGSPVFKTMMESGLSEAKTGRINITDVSGKTMEILLHYMYTGSVKTNFDDLDVVELTYAAGKYQMTLVLKYLDNLFGAMNMADWDTKTLAPLMDLTGKLTMKKAEEQLRKEIVQRAISAVDLSDVFSIIGDD